MLTSTFLLLLLLPYIYACPSGSIQGGTDGKSCYKIATNQKSWVEAEFDCQFSRGHLLSIHSAFLNTYFGGLAYENLKGRSDFWLGGSALLGANWQWIDGTRLDYQNWAKGQPSDSSNSSCMVMQIADGTWQSANCSTTKSYICQIPPKNEPICPDNWVYVPSLKKCYFMNTSYRNWTSSETYCNTQGGHLVAIHSDYELAQVVAISSHYYATRGAYFWIGLSNLNSTGWVWSDGSTVDYLNFYQQQSGYFYGSMSSCSTSCSGWNTCSNGYCTGNNNGGNQFAMCQQSANTY